MRPTKIHQLVKLIPGYFLLLVQIAQVKTEMVVAWEVAVAVQQALAQIAQIESTECQHPLIRTLVTRGVVL